MEHLKFSEILQQNKVLAGTIDAPKIKIGILSNVTVNSFKEILEYSLRTNKIEPLISVGNFDNIVQDTEVFSDQETIIILYDTLGIVDNVSGYFEDISDDTFELLVQKLLTEINLIFENLKSVPSVLFNTFSSAYFESGYTYNSRIDSFVSRINQYLYQNKPVNTTIIDIDKMYGRIGIQQAIDMRFYNSSKAPYSVTFLKTYATAILPVFLKVSGKLKKAIIFDCDNTLWKGVIGEDGLDGIDMSSSTSMGKYYHRIQEIAVYLSKKGVIVGLCSKNNEDDVVEVLRQHNDMLLKEDYIVIKKINWEDKATNLKAIAAELNIGVDSLVFVDDSSFEINLIQEQLPEVLAIQVPEKINQYPELILQKAFTHFNLNASKDDVAKTAMYKQQFEREHEKKSFGTIEDYLASLEMSVQIGVNNQAYLQRVTQLTQKTNQFNLTTYRYTESQVQQFFNQSGTYIFTIFVRDKFGDNGLTGLAIIHTDAQNARYAEIDTLLMSCRIIGRNIEYVFLNYIVEFLKQKGYSTLSSTYIPTAKNAQVSSFYPKFGFETISEESNGSRYSLDLTQINCKEYSYINIESELKN